MKTEQEQIKEMAEKMKRCFEKNGLLNFKWFAEALVQAGYGEVSEYKAEIERLRQEVRDTDKMARNSIEQYKNNYDNAFERLKAQEREIEKLKAKPNEQSRKSGILGYNVTVEFHDDEVSEHSVDCKYIEKYAKQFRNRIITINEKEIKQAKIDVLNELREKYATSGSVNSNWATIIFVDDIDELIKEVENDK